MNFIDLFCGAGGKSVGFERAGFKPLIAIDKDKNAIETYLFNRKKSNDQLVTINDDISNLSVISERKIKSVIDLNVIDLIIGGPPCQGFSNANKQRVIDDPRNRLYKKFVEFVSEIKPEIFVMENVIGIKKIENQIKDDFNRAGYKTVLEIINAADYGVPQNRYRAFFIGIREKNKDKLNSIVYNIKRFKNYKKFTLKDAIEDLPILEAAKIKNNYENESYETGFSCVKYRYGKNEFRKMINNGEEIGFLYNHKSRYNNDRDIEIFKRLPQGCNSSHESIKEIMPYKTRKNIFKDKYFKLDYNKVSKTITAHMQFDCNMYIHPNQARGLTPREAARIQTFPDNYIFRGAFTTWYRQIGNAVPCQLSYIIAKSIKEVGIFNDRK